MATLKCTEKWNFSDWVKRLEEVRAENSIVRVAEIDFLPEQIEEIFERKLYILKRWKISKVIKSKAGEYRAKTVYTRQTGGKVGFTLPGRYFVQTAEEINRLMGFELAPVGEKT